MIISIRLNEKNDKDILQWLSNIKPGDRSKVVKESLRRILISESASNVVSLELNKEDKDLLAWLSSVDKRERQILIKSIIRAYILGLTSNTQPTIPLSHKQLPPPSIKSNIKDLDESDEDYEDRFDDLINKF